jgi:ribose-phosphate pyrophosphokinase
VAPARDIVATDVIDRIVVTDSVPPFRLEGHGAREKLDVVSLGPLLGEAIRRLHTEASIADLITDP